MTKAQLDALEERGYPDPDDAGFEGTYSEKPMPTAPLGVWLPIHHEKHDSRKARDALLQRSPVSYGKGAILPSPGYWGRENSFN